MPALATPQVDWQKVSDYPHRTGAFTQGLEVDGDTLLESSGLYGRSFVARWQLDSDRAVQLVPLPAKFFAEGLTRLGDRLYLLTWRERRGLVLDAATLQQTESFEYDGEGWGLTNDGARLVMSDGSAELRFLDPQTLRESDRLTVRERGRPVPLLNELEWLPAGVLGAEPRLLANIWTTDRIVVIDPSSGKVTGEIDLHALYRQRTPGSDVLNGIAWDARDSTLLVTGKRWPKVYRLRLLPPSSAPAGN